MARVNKNTAGAFTYIVGTETEISLYDTFMNIQSSLKKPTNELKEFIGQYKTIITNNKVMFENLSELENIIMQIRTRDNLTEKDIKFNVVREYIYARVPFHRLDKESKDFRAIVGLTEFHGDNIDKMYDDKEFMSKTMKKMKDGMTVIINQNIDLFKKRK